MEPHSLGISSRGLPGLADAGRPLALVVDNYFVRQARPQVPRCFRVSSTGFAETSKLDTPVVHRGTSTRDTSGPRCNSSCVCNTSSKAPTFRTFQTPPPKFSRQMVPLSEVSGCLLFVSSFSYEKSGKGRERLSTSRIPWKM